MLASEEVQGHTRGVLRYRGGDRRAKYGDGGDFTLTCLFTMAIDKEEARSWEGEEVLEALYLKKVATTTEVVWRHGVALAEYDVTVLDRGERPNSQDVDEFLEGKHWP